MSSEIGTPMFGFPIGPWHRWFAWRPVSTVDRGWVWLRRVSRRRYQTKTHLGGPTMHWFHYAFEDQTTKETA